MPVLGKKEKRRERLGMGKSKKIVQTVKGTRDFYPEKMAVRTWLYTKVREVSESFGYQEYEGPFLESIDLYAAKSGEELVKEQSFVFPDRGGNLIALRPELTPTLARMVAQKQGQLTFPVRWWSFGPFWRYERPQKGRTREFFQWNLDLLGTAATVADVEIVSVIADFLHRVGLSPSDVSIEVNNRQLMDAQLSKIGVMENKKAVFRLIDRKEKLKHDAWVSYASETGLTSQQIDDLIALLENEDLWEESAELIRFFELIEAVGLRDYIHYNPGIIRGLDYYTGIVYEAKSKNPHFRRSILGGGRYDNLLADVGGNPLTGVGFAMGDVVISLLLEEMGKLPSTLGNPPAPLLVTIFDEERMADSLRVARSIRESGINASIYPGVTKLGKQFKYADRIGAWVVVVVGPDEAANTMVTVKNLKNGTQNTISQKSLPEYLANLLETHVPS